MTNTSDTPSVDLAVTVEELSMPPEPAPEAEPEDVMVVETTDDDTVEETVFEDSRLAETVLDGAQPIIPAPANLAPTPPAATEATPVLPQSRLGSLDLTEPILDILTNPTV